jgi:putative transposase
MSQQATLYEIATALKISKQASGSRARKEAWPYQEEPHPGGKRRLYPLASLPKNVRSAVMAHRLSAVTPTAQAVVSTALANQAITPHAAVTTESDRAERDARCLVEREIRQMMDRAGCSKETAITTLLTNARAGRLDPAIDKALRRARDPRGLKGDGYPSVSSVKRYLRMSDKTPGRRAKDFSIKAWHRDAIVLRQRPQGSTTVWITEELAKLGHAVNYDQVYRFFRDKYSQIDQTKGRYTGSQLRSHRFYQHRTADGLAPGDEVHGDGWNTHFTAPHPVTGEFVTYEVWHFHDVATRYVTPPGLGLTEHFEVIAKGLENFIRVIGIPKIVQMDSTKIVKGSDRFTKAAHSLEERIGCTIVHPVEVGNSQANGICENFNTSWLDKKSRELATYQGSSMDTLSFRRVKKLTAAMVKAEKAGNQEEALKRHAEAEHRGKGRVFRSHQEAIDWITTTVAEYNDRPHRSLKKVMDDNGKTRHQTPREALIEHIANGWEPEAVDEDTLIDLFRPHKQKTVKRETVSTYGSMRYRNPEVLGHWNTKEVLVAYDIHDWQKVWVKTLQGELICEAWFVSATGYRAKSAYEAAEEKRANAQLKRLEKKSQAIKDGRMSLRVIEMPGDGLISARDIIDPGYPPERGSSLNVPMTAHVEIKPLSHFEAAGLLKPMVPGWSTMHFKRLVAGWPNGPMEQDLENVAAVLRDEAETEQPVDIPPYSDTVMMLYSDETDSTDGDELTEEAAG